MGNFLTKDNIIKILIVLVIITLPIVLAVIFGKINLKLPFFQQTSKTQSSPSSTEKTSTISLYCPSVNDFCKEGQQIMKNNVYIGFGGKLGARKPIKTAFNGKISVSYRNEPNEKITVVRLDNFEAKKTAFYFFIGETLPLNEIPTAPNGYVKVNTPIGEVTKDMQLFDASLLFQLFDGDPTQSQQQTLQPNSFINGE